MDEPDRRRTSVDGVEHETLVHQVGWGGVRLGRIDVTFEAGGAVLDREAVRYDVSDSGRL